MSMKSILVSNLCTKTRIRTIDNHILQCFSAFYEHPALIDEDSWKLIKNGEQRIMVDTDTMYLMKDMVCEWGHDPKSDIILTVKLTSTETDSDERMKRWNHLYEYSMKLKKAMNDHFDSKKLDSLTAQMSSASISDSAPAEKDSDDDDPKPESIPVVKE